MALEAGEQTALIYGSCSGTVYVLPLEGACSLRTKVQSSGRLWWGLLIVLVVFCGVVLPVLLWLGAWQNEDPAHAARDP